MSLRANATCIVRRHSRTGENMSNSANVNSVDAIRQFAAAVAKFQEEARLCLNMMDAQLRQILFWLERDRPGFWKHEIENCMREVADARVRLHQCRMRKLGDFRPSCIEEVKDLEKSRNDVEFAQKQIPNVKRWFDEINARPAVQRALQVLADQSTANQAPHTDKSWDILFGNTQFRKR